MAALAIELAGAAALEELDAAAEVTGGAATEELLDATATGVELGLVGGGAATEVELGVEDSDQDQCHLC